MNLLCKLLLCLAILTLPAGARAQPEIFGPGDFTVHTPPFFIHNVAHAIELECLRPEKLALAGTAISVVVNGQRLVADFSASNKVSFDVKFDRQEPLSVKAGGFTFVKKINPMPLWLSIVPPLLVILLALIFKEVVSSLIIGILAGASIAGYYSIGVAGIFTGFLRVVDTYVVTAMTDVGHVSVIVFSTLIGGLVAVISRNGGMYAVVEKLSKKATNARSGQFISWLLGIAIFFDDYANTLVVGNTMRPLTDKLRISREKLSYIVDATAAPVAAIALITTWIGAELGYIEGALNTINMGNHDITESAYSVFVSSLRYAFYPVLTLIFILILIFTGRDYGPMFKAEISARNTGSSPGAMAHGQGALNEFAPAAGVPLRMRNAIIPIFIVVTGTVVGLFATGFDPEVWSEAGTSFGMKISTTIGKSDSYKALLWASMSALIVAIVLTVTQRIMPFGKAVDASIDGFKTMVNAVVILILAWALAAVTEQLHTADFLASSFGGNVAPWAIPAITFVIAAVVSFSTGTAWGTMAIVYPLMLPLVWELSIQEGYTAAMAMALFSNATSAVLAGAVLGDHCSPISDTTILSSLATNCDHIEHVRTQMPYAITVGIISLILTLLTAGLQLPWYLAYLIGIAGLVAVVRILGKRVEPV
jgi:Na+/H+ antiporter NhaC